MKLTSSRHRLIVAALACVVGCATFLINVSAGASTRVGPARLMIVVLRDQNRSLAPRSDERASAVKVEQAPIVRSLRASGATRVTSLSVMNALIARVSASEARTLAKDPAVAQVVADDVLPGPPLSSRPVAGALGAKVIQDPTSKISNAATCGTAKNPQLNPEALTNINATPAQLGSDDGAGVTVAILADGVDTADPDFQRNAAYGTPGQAVVKEFDFSSDGTSAPTQGAEAFGDASSIVAQGDAVYDLSQYVSPTHPLPSGCDIKIVGVAPGANVEALKVFATNNDTTESGFLEAINFAVESGAKVINESFSSTNFPDTALDVTREANDAAVAAGVTVVVSSGDAGSTSTIDSPASDPDVISVGATTTFRTYSQLTYGGINDPAASGSYVDNNISSLSSGGYAQGGNTVDLVAPGDLNWALCSTNYSVYADCVNENGAGSPLELFGGTSESAPLTAGAAADVIQAYASTHDGLDPTPAMVKEILMSTASDVGAPASEQGAGLLNVLAAVREARSIDAASGNDAADAADGGLLLDPTQINVVQDPGDTADQSVQMTNIGASAVTVNLSTRALATTPVATQTGSFCMQPRTPTQGCPANTGTFAIWSGVNEVYQDVNFRVPATSGLSRLEFAAAYTHSGQSSLLHFALLEPNGAYAAYSLPQGLADYGEVEVSDPPPGRWTAVFFTQGDGYGTSAAVQWSANTVSYVAGGTISPSSLTIAPGQTGVAHLSLTSSNVAGDTSQSVVVSSRYGTNTVPVTVRTSIPTTAQGGTFSGVLTGGNGRPATQAATNTYDFNVPSDEADLDVSLTLSSDPDDTFIAELIDPNGQTVGYSTNAAAVDAYGIPTGNPSVTLYKADPVAGRWDLVVDWLNPVTGLELKEPFTGTIQFDHVNVIDNLPDNGPLIASGTAKMYVVNVVNTANAPEAFFVDPRWDQTETINLLDQNFPATAADMTLPLSAGLGYPYYLVPSQTSELRASITGSAPVTFDLEYFPGDPDIAPGLNDQSGTSGSIDGDSASVTFSDPEVSPGLWLLNPAELGPFPVTGAPLITASANLSAVTQTFDPWMTSSTGDLWSEFNGLSTGFSPVVLQPGQATSIAVTVAPTGAPGTKVSGTLFVDDYALNSGFVNGLVQSDELAAIPYSYTISH